MHGQKRDEYKARLRDEATAKKLAQKAQQWNALSAELLKRRRSTKSDGAINKETIETLHLTEKLLTVNPDPMYLWNHRRELLMSLTAATSGCDRPADDNNGNACGGDDCRADPISISTLSPSEFIRQEQVLTQAALQRNPKAYGAWFHRKWSIRHYLRQMLDKDRKSKDNGATDDGSTSEACMILCKDELILCSEFLMLDERNFHCWNYRRFIVGTLTTLLQMSSSGSEDLSHSLHIDGAWDIQLNIEDIPLIGAQITSSNHNLSENYKYQENAEIYKLLQKEFEFTFEKIAQNFSNGSAFHYRSKLLPLIHHFDLSEVEAEDHNTVKIDRIQQELEIVRNATFTEPDDQTPWWYLRFILSWARDGQQLDDEALEELKGVLYEEWESFDGLVQMVEDEGGKCKWGLLALHMIATEFCEIDQEFEGEEWTQLKKSYAIQLKELDPDRSRRYDMLMQEDSI